MNNDTTYNGWSNRETWLTNLWLTNDEYSYDMLMAIVESSGNSQFKANQLEERIANQFESEISEYGLMHDLLQTAYSRIDWNEIILNHEQELEDTK